MDQNLERLHRALVDAMQHARGDDFGRPVTVSQIYQELVPYRTARGLVGFEMNADYEYTLLRLLAGEGDLAWLEPVEVREQLQRELDSPNPNVSLFRAYANCDVFIAPVPGEFAERTVPAVEAAPEPMAEPPQPPPPHASPRDPARPRCPGCGTMLPADRQVQYCPHCGRHFARTTCSKCGENLEPDWRFCANCGTAVSART